MLKLLVSASLVHVATAGTFIQEVCTDAQCSQGCHNNTLPTDTCLQVTGGGSAKVTACSSSGVTLMQYSSSDCTGAGSSQTQPVNVCAKIAGGAGYLENICGSDAAAAQTTTVSLASLSSADHDAIRQKFIDEINAKQSLWKAGHNPRFRGQPVGSADVLLGVLPSEETVRQQLIDSGEFTVVDKATRDIPSDFDSATGFPKCAKMINDIRDQSACGCCWAFGSAEAASDRLCTQTNGSVVLPLSAQDLCFCSNSNGCGGGQPSSAWNYIKRTGIVTGSQQQPDDGKTDPFVGMGFCSSFSLPHCHHHGPTGNDPYPAEKTSGCPSASSPKCPKKCDSDAKAPHNEFDKDKVKVSAVSTFNGADALAEALMDNGPLTVAFTVYKDFENYAGGIYKRTSFIPAGGHAVKLTGFGTDPASGTKYWKVANSWNPYWGENGFFRIVRGKNECGIENGAVGSSKGATWSYPK